MVINPSGFIGPQGFSRCEQVRPGRTARGEQRAEIWGEKQMAN